MGHATDPERAVPDDAAPLPLRPQVPGIIGYERSVTRFVERSQSLKFDEVCRDFLGFLPAPGRNVLDAGAGAGQNAAALASRGYEVVAVEPMPGFLRAARAAYPDLGIRWIGDSLPALAALGSERAQFDFILVEAVWHHLDDAERASALARLAHLLRVGGSCALSLRNGPPGMGTHVFPTDATDTIELARRLGLDCVQRRDDLPSVLDGKADVRWCRLVLRKTRTPV